MYFFSSAWRWCSCARFAFSVAAAHSVLNLASGSSGPSTRRSSQASRYSWTSLPLAVVSWMASFSASTLRTVDVRAIRRSRSILVRPLQTKSTSNQHVGGKRCAHLCSFECKIPSQAWGHLEASHCQQVAPELRKRRHHQLANGKLKIWNRIYL